MVSDQPGARALETAPSRRASPRRSAVCRVRVARGAGGGHPDSESASADPDLVVLAGYMRMVPPEFVRTFPWRIINLHPALLPGLSGHTSIKDALEHGVKVTGVTVHFVDEGLDTGPIIAQEAVRIREGDTAKTLAERIHAVEHELLPHTIRLLAAGKSQTPSFGNAGGAGRLERVSK